MNQIAVCKAINSLFALRERKLNARRRDKFKQIANEWNEYI